MNINFIEFTNIICNKIEKDGGESQLIMINGGVMKLWLSENGDGVMNSRYTALNCKFKIL